MCFIKSNTTFSLWLLFFRSCFRSHSLCWNHKIFSYIFPKSFYILLHIIRSLIYLELISFCVCVCVCARWEMWLFHMWVDCFFFFFSFSCKNTWHLSSSETWLSGHYGPCLVNMWIIISSNRHDVNEPEWKHQLRF